MKKMPSVTYRYSIAKFYWDTNEQGQECLTLLMPDGKIDQWVKSDAYFAVKLSAATKEMLKLDWKIQFIDKPSNEPTELDKIKKFRNMS